MVDDDKFFRSVIGNVLRLAGFEVLEADDGEAAFRIVTEELLHLDLLLLDLYMPGITDIELVDRIRRVGHELDLALVLITGAELARLDEDALARLGADAILQKTATPELVLETVEAALENHEKRRGEVSS